MHYEARIQAVVTYHAKYHDAKVTKTAARRMVLTREQYMQVTMSYKSEYLVSLSMITCISINI